MTEEQLYSKIEEQRHTIQQLLTINTNLMRSLRDVWRAALPEAQRLYGELEILNAEDRRDTGQGREGGPRTEDQGAA
jgi:hypothetical protein